MTFFSTKRKSGLPSPASGILSSRKSKLPTPNKQTPQKPTPQGKPVSSSSSSAKKIGTISNGSIKIVSCDVTPKKAAPQAARTPVKSATSNVQKSPARRTPSKLSPTRPSTPSSAESSVDTEEAVRVCVRIRPLLENDNEPRSFVLGPTENTVIKDMYGGSDNIAYKFNHAYGETSTTQQVYDDMVADIVESVGRQGRNGTVFTYGQVSTYLMIPHWS